MRADDRRRRNERMFRTVNEKITELNAVFEELTGQSEFVCECDEIACAEHVSIRVAELGRVHASPERYVIVPGHEGPRSLERVVERHASYVVVEKSPASDGER